MFLKCLNILEILGHVILYTVVVIAFILIDELLFLNNDFLGTSLSIQ